MAQNYYPRGQKYELVTIKKEFYQIMFVKETVIDGTIRATAYFSEQQKVQNAVNKMEKQGTIITSIIHWNIPENIEFGKLALHHKEYHEAQTEVIDKFIQ